MKVKEKNQIEALKGLEPKSELIEGIFRDGYESSEIKNKVDEIKEYEENINRKKWFIIQAKNYLILIYLKQ